MEEIYQFTVAYIRSSQPEWPRKAWPGGIVADKASGSFATVGPHTIMSGHITIGGSVGVIVHSQSLALKELVSRRFTCLHSSDC